ncbi:MAG TPA: DUF192 domain-containing protein [Patescibacteria group bacterium]|nr:DUF192 domain-containing protein [Patescibacteria group bacterium]
MVVFIVLIFTIGVLVAIERNQTHFKDVKIGNTVFTLEVADTDKTREKGLSDRYNLPKNSGMLFDFKTLGDWRMWMIDMRFDIDMAWLNSNNQIIYIKTDATPGSYPQTFGAGSPSRYVIEVPANTFNELDIHIGDPIKIN